MSGYSILLFVHVSSAILIFTGIGTLIFGVAALRLAKTVQQVHAIARPMLFGRKIGLEHISVIDVLTIAGVVLTAASGLYMATNWGFGRGWIEAAIASFALMAPVGPLVINPRLHAIRSAADAARPGPPDGNLLARTHDPFTYRRIAERDNLAGRDRLSDDDQALARGISHRHAHRAGGWTGGQSGSVASRLHGTA